jgi:hypothetical protein
MSSPGMSHVPAKDGGSELARVVTSGRQPVTAALAEAGPG